MIIKILIIIVLSISSLVSCGKKIPEYGKRVSGYVDNTLLIMAVENESGNPIMLQTIFEPKNSFGNDNCWIRGRCKNIKHSFNLSGKYEIICCLQSGEYTLKKLNFKSRNSNYTLGSLNLNERFIIRNGEMVFLNKKYGINKTRVYSKVISANEREFIISNLKKIENFSTWNLKKQISWEDIKKQNTKIVKTKQIQKKEIPPKPKVENVTLSSKEKSQTIIVPTGTLGDISEVRKKMLEKTLESKIDDYFDIVPKDLFEEAQEKAFEELEYEECTEEQCIMLIKEMLQVENSFQMVLMAEDGDTQISLTWNDLDKKRVEEEYCEGCKTKELRKMVEGLVEKLVSNK